jgi:DNA-binding HxlR family transcriptional regulator
MIVLRDLLTGKERFSEFAASPEGIPTNLLSERLARLEGAGLVRRVAYQQRPPRYSYQLTEAGRAFKPVLVAMCHWGNAYIEGTWRPPASFLK